MELFLRFCSNGLSGLNGYIGPPPSLHTKTFNFMKDNTLGATKTVFRVDLPKTQHIP
jgi:hypothetical protein